jgi:hypothetical protein
MYARLRLQARLHSKAVSCACHLGAMCLMVQHARCLTDAVFPAACVAGVAVGGAISLFPRAYPAAATAITRGVQVRRNG